MSFIKSFIKIILTILLVVSLISLIFSLSLYQFTSYDNLKPRIGAFVEQQFSQEILQLSSEEVSYLKDTLIKNCSQNQEISLPLDEGNPIISEVKINCSEINEKTTIEEFVALTSKGIFNSLYYKEYNCSLVNCLKDVKKSPETISILASKKANSSFLVFTIVFLIISLILIASLVLLSAPKFTCLYNLAPAFLISGLLFLTKNGIVSLASSIQEPLQGLLYSFAKSMFVNSLIVFILGIIFLVLAIILKITKKKSR